MTNGTAEMWAKMKTHNIRQKDIAERVGVTEQYLSMVFNGKRESSFIFGKIENAIDEIIAEQHKKAKGEQHGTAAN